MPTRRAIEEMDQRVKDACTEKDFALVIVQLDAHAKPLRQREQHIATMLGDLQSLRVAAEHGQRKLKRNSTRKGK